VSVHNLGILDSGLRCYSRPRTPDFGSGRVKSVVLLASEISWNRLAELVANRLVGLQTGNLLYVLYCRGPESGVVRLPFALY
jgi:hypothetical protein